MTSWNTTMNGIPTEVSVTYKPQPRNRCTKCGEWPKALVAHKSTGWKKLCFKCEEERLCLAKKR